MYALFMLLLYFSFLQSGEIVIRGKYNAVLQTEKINQKEYISTSKLAAVFGGRRFFVDEKAKEALKIFGIEFVFTVANQYVVVDGVPYNIGSFPLRNKETFLVPVDGFLKILCEIEKIGARLSSDTLIIGATKTNEIDAPVNNEKTSDREQENKFVVVIDPGHGGKDPGAKGKRGTLEKNITLDIAKRLKALLEKNGIIAYITRDKDEFVPLHKRVKFANDKKANVFVSIHCNGSKLRDMNGTEVYFLAPAKTNIAREVAAKENASLLLEDNPPVKDLSEIEAIVASLLHNAFLRESNELAGYIQKHLVSQTKLQNRGVNQAGFYVLTGAFMPAVLVETAFITNLEEENLLRSPTFRDRCARGILNGILEYKRVLSLR